MDGEILDIKIMQEEVFPKNKWVGKFVTLIMNSIQSPPLEIIFTG